MTAWQEVDELVEGKALRSWFLLLVLVENSYTTNTAMLAPSRED
jgi:hypothetical protein